MDEIISTINEMANKKNKIKEEVLIEFKKELDNLKDGEKIVVKITKNK